MRLSEPPSLHYQQHFEVHSGDEPLQSENNFSARRTVEKLAVAVNTSLGCEAEDLQHIDRNGGYSGHLLHCWADVLLARFAVGHDGTLRVQL